LHPNVVVCTLSSVSFTVAASLRFCDKMNRWPSQNYYGNQVGGSARVHMGNTYIERVDGLIISSF
jgi:hypothetical protein